jgi:hypothetical protein
MNLTERLQKAKTEFKATKYPKKVFINKGRSRNFHLLDIASELKPAPTLLVYLHSGFTNPNTNKSNLYKCLGNPCPLCRECDDLYKREKASDIKTSWKKRKGGYFLFWAFDVDNFEIVLLHLRKGYTYQDKITKETRTVEGWADLVFAKIEGFGKRKMNPFDVDKGHVITLESRIVSNKHKKLVSISQKETELPEVIKEQLNKFKDNRTASNKELADLNISIREFDHIYQDTSFEDLQKVVNNVSYTPELVAKAVKKEIDLDIEEVSENDVDFDLEASQVMETPRKQTLQERVKNLGTLD